MSYKLTVQITEIEKDVKYKGSFVIDEKAYDFHLEKSDYPDSLFGYFLGVVIGGKHVKMPFDLAYVLMVSVIGTVEQYLEPHQFTNSSSIPSVTIDLEPNMDIIVRDFLSQDAQYVQ
ncbi:MAG: hypothetical protein J4428_00435 [Candidatus Aenigmarchaeota archaeon]|nr:hypothetical protein [Candidatus Aenigmarchaeota archaeon]